MSELVLRCRQLQVGYRGAPVAFVDLDCPTGVMLMCGSNGVGKTTLLRTLAGVIPPVDGSFAIDGLARPGSATSGLGAVPSDAPVAYLPQEVDAPGWLRISDALAFYCWAVGGDIDVARERLGELGVEGLTARMRTSSVGTRRLVALAAVLASEPAVLLLDEPFAGVGLGARVAARSAIRRLARARPVIIVSHLLEDVVATADSIAVMTGGRVTGSQSIADLEAEAGGRGVSVEELVAELLGAQSAPAGLDA